MFWYVLLDVLIHFYICGPIEKILKKSLSSSVATLIFAEAPV